MLWVFLQRYSESDFRKRKNNQREDFWKKMRKFKVGDREIFSKTLTETDIYGFAGISGDFNPIHVNRIEAEKSRFGRQVCHGMLVASLISAGIGMKLPGPGAIYLEQNLKFLKPVFVGDTVTAQVEVASVDADRLALITTVVNHEGELVISGDARVMVSDG